MSPFVIKDNSKLSTGIELPLVESLLNKDLSLLSKDDFLIFPQQLSDSIDLDRDNYVFQKRNGETWTCM